MDADGSYAYTQTAPTNLNRIVFDHLDSLFPAVNGFILGESGKEEGKNGFVNGAQGGTGECHLPVLTCNVVRDIVDWIEGRAGWSMKGAAGAGVYEIMVYNVSERSSVKSLSSLEGAWEAERDFCRSQLEIKTKVIADPKTIGTDYFSMCFLEHLPEDVDLVLIELGEVPPARLLKSSDNLLTFASLSNQR